jgi:hypothetical protein
MAGLSTTARNKLPKSKFAFPDERKEPLTDAKHVRNAISRFDQVEGVSNAERDRAWKRILSAAKKFGVDVSEKSWRELVPSEKNDQDEALQELNAHQAREHTRQADEEGVAQRASA